MRENTKAIRRRQALASAAVSALLQAASAALLLLIRWLWLPGDGFLSWLLVGLAAADLILLIPLGFSLRERLREIQGGEEDEARQY